MTDTAKAECEVQWRAVGAWARRLAGKEGDLTKEERQLELVGEFADRQHSFSLLKRSSIEPVETQSNESENSYVVAQSPLSAMCTYLDMGVYPPPEILLGLRDSMKAYMNSNGDLTLEKAFFGPPKRKAGNYARRMAKGRQLFFMAFEIVAHSQAHDCSLATAADACADRWVTEYGGDRETLIAAALKEVPKRIPKVKEQ